MKQFLLREYPLPDGRVILSGKDYHYLVRVRRVKTGDLLRGTLPDGSPALLTVTAVGKDTLICEASVETRGADGDAETSQKDGDQDGGKKDDRNGESTNNAKIILLQAVPQPAKMDLLVRQSTEGGVHTIVPFVSRYSVKASPAMSRLERWRRIVREARQQSGSRVATTIEEVRGGVDEALAYYRETRAAAQDANTSALLLHEKSADGAFHQALASHPNTVFVVIGPEGGLADEETAAFVQNGFTMINMGPNVLRVETAAAWAVSAVSVILKEAPLWKSRESWKV